MTYLAVLLVLLLWAATIWMGARMAWNRGRSTWLGGGIAAALPFVGLLVVSLLPRNDEQATLRTAAMQQQERREEITALEERDSEHRRSRRRRIRRGRAA